MPHLTCNKFLENKVGLQMHLKSEVPITHYGDMGLFECKGPKNIPTTEIPSNLYIV
jgi:hypothetical protein